MKTIAFFGHRRLYKDKEAKLRFMEVLKQKVPEGYSNFLIGRHGEFDNMILSSSLEYKKHFDKEKMAMSVIEPK